MMADPAGDSKIGSAWLTYGLASFDVPPVLRSRLYFEIYQINRLNIEGEMQFWVSSLTFKESISKSRSGQAINNYDFMILVIVEVPVMDEEDQWCLETTQ